MDDNPSGEQKKSSNVETYISCGCAALLIAILIAFMYFVTNFDFLQSLASKLKGLKSSIPGLLREDCEQFLSQKYIPDINKAAEKYDVDPALIAAVIEQESSWNPNAESTAGAQGLMQLMPGTATGMGVKDPFNAQQNIDGGTKYLKGLIDRYGGDVDRALAAYNAGPGAVDFYGTIPPYEETQDYVTYVNSNYEKYRRCIEEYGGAGGVPQNASENGRKVLEEARNYQPGTCSGINCYEHTVAVYNNAGMKLSSVGLDQWGTGITVQPQPGYIMDLDLDGNGTADHTVLFDHEEIINGKRIWYFWNADASNAWVYTDKPYVPNSNDPKVPWSPDEGLPLHMWEPIPK